MTIEQTRSKIAEIVNQMHLTQGLGDADNACSFAAVNLALSGELTDKCPDCASDVLWNWGIVTQDAMPDDLRNSQLWKDLLPLVAGTGKAHEKERFKIILDHMWTVVLPYLQPLADEKGFGNEWRRMILERTPEAAREAVWAAAAGAKTAARAAVWAEAAGASEYENVWTAFDPCGLLKKLIAVSEGDAR